MIHTVTRLLSAISRPAILIAGIVQLAGCETGTLGPGADQLDVTVTLSATQMTAADTLAIQVIATNNSPCRIGYYAGGCGNLLFAIVDAEGTRVYPTNPWTCNASLSYVEFAGHETKAHTYRFDLSLAQGGTLAPGTYEVSAGLTDQLLSRSAPVALQVVSATMP